MILARCVRPLLGLLTLGLVACTPTPQQHYDAVSFYFCAHPDDCLLFMNPNLYDDVHDQANKVVTVYFTSGDAGRGVESEGRKTPYYRAREIGALAADRWMADADDKVSVRASGEEATEVNGKSIATYHYKNTTSYFLRLPDGMYRGQGADGTGRQSLARLKNGNISHITAIDKSADYKGWGDLVATIAALIRKESVGIPRVAVNVTDTDTGVNIGDHSDHTYGGLAVMEAIRPYSCIAVAKFENYITAERAPNVTDKGLYAEIGSFAVMTAAYGEQLYDNTWDKDHRINLGRNYFTFENTSEACSF